jgi:cytochrome bd ubiquinol oxidase subunit I
MQRGETDVTMEQQAFLFDLIRIKFGFMACFHYIFVPLTLGLIVSAACMESTYLWTRDAAWRAAAHFWFRLFTLGWLLGLVTGYPLRAQLIGDWGNYFTFVKPVLDRVLPIETALGPVMLAGVGAIALFGPRLYPATRMLISWGLVLAMFCQSACILAVNAWMQHPLISNQLGSVAGALVRAPTLRDLFSNPMALSKIAHVYSAALVCGSTFICAIAAAYLYRRVHLPVARVSLRLGIPLGALATACVMVTGHFSADHVARFQPMKFAAIEGLWKHEDGPAGLIVFARPQLEAQINSGEIKIPYAMSVLTGYGLSGSPRGIREEVAEQEDRIRAAISRKPVTPESPELGGYRELYDRERARADGIGLQEDLVHRAALRTVPNVPVLFGGFRAMVFIGLCLLAIYTAALILHKRVLAGGASAPSGHRRLLWILPGILPLPWLASTSGWIVAEMGRQPWVVYGYLPTLSGAQLPALEHGVFGTLLVTSLYISLAFLFALLTLRLIRRGPGAPLLSAPWWLRICGPDRVATA